MAPLMFVIGFHFLSLVTSTQILTTHGPVEGFTQSVDGKTVETFLGIPFAKPPTGKLRFRAPQPLDQWSEPVQAKNFPNSCIQFRKPWKNIPLGHVFMPDNQESEDCLYLNVWTPSVENNRNLAVMVWIHGGGYTVGSTSVSGYSGERLSAYGDVVVVSIQYRLGSLGFLYLANEKVPGNMGLLDQQLALRWVAENINKFGGDPKRVTLFGESSGGFSVGMHMLSTGSRDLFQYGILQSGTPTCYWGFTEPDKALSISKRITQEVGCLSDNDEELIECLISVEVQSFTKHSTIEFATTDGVFVDNTPSELLRLRQYKKTSILAGFTAEEGSMFLVGYTSQELFPSMHEHLTPWPFERVVSELVRPIFPDNPLAKEAAEFEYGIPTKCSGSLFQRSVELANDLIINSCSMPFLEEYSKQDHPVFIYKFNYRSKNHMFPEWMGVTHGIEIYYIFGRSSYNFTEEEELFSRRVMQYFSDFAKTGLPSTTDEWPPYEQENKTIGVLQPKGFELTHGLYHRGSVFWNSYIQKLGASVSGKQVRSTLIYRIQDIPKLPDKTSGKPGTSGKESMKSMLTTTFLVFTSVFSVVIIYA